MKYNNHEIQLILKLVGYSNNMECKEIFLFKILNILYYAMCDVRWFSIVAYLCLAISGINTHHYYNQNYPGM